MKLNILSGSLLSVGALLPCFAGEFINLDFNSPDLSHVVVGPGTGTSFAPLGEAIAGWTVAYVSSPLPLPPQLPVENGGQPPISLVPSKDPESYARCGAYSLQISQFADAPIIGTPTPRPLTTFSQRGTVPADASSLDIVSTSSFFNEIEVWVNGSKQATSGFPLEGKQLDVRAFAGQEIFLEFRVPGNWVATLDVRGFTSVPEPSTWALFVVGLGVLTWAHRGRK